MSKKIYVISEISFEYNDEYYYQGESDGGTPVEAFSTKERAKQELPVYTRNWIKEQSESKWGSIQDYIGEDEDGFRTDVFAKHAGIDESEVRDAFDRYDSAKINKLILDNLDAAVKAFTLKLFKITEIELADETATTR